MINEQLTTLIERLHNSGIRLVYEFAGAGSLALYWLHAVGGSSRTVFEATDRYSASSMTDLLGQPPEQFVARITAEAMAERAYYRAMSLSDGASGCLGIACTAAIATDRIKKGDHGCWVALRDRHGSHAYGLVISKGQRMRLAEEELISRLVIHALIQHAQLGGVDLGLIANEQVDLFTEVSSDPIAQLFAGEIASVTVASNGTLTANHPWHGGILSGSFKPLHAGHEQLAQAAAVALGQPIAFEIPIVNADKPILGYGELERRLAQFRGRHTVLLNRAPRFVDKAILYPGCTFVLGFDTATRLLEPRFFQGPEGALQGLRDMRAHDCRVLVAGRVRDGVFRTLADLPIPAGFEDLFIDLPEHLFRSDISSTAIRAQQSIEALKH